MKKFIFQIVIIITSVLRVQAEDLYSYMADAEAWLKASYENESLALENGLEAIKKIEMSNLSQQEKVKEIKTFFPNAFIFDNSVTNLGEASWERAEKYYSLGKFSQALYWYEKSANYEYPNGQYCLGRCYFDGEGIAQNYSEAVRWFRLSAEQGDQLGQISLGMCYEFGKGVTQDNSEALRWYTLAAEQGHSYAQYIIAENYYKERSYSEALEWLTKSAEHGDADAQFALGEFYYSIHNFGTYERSFKEWCVQQNFDHFEAKNTAFEWYKKAAEQGHSKAQFVVGYLLSSDEAYKWFRKSAMQGNVDALLCLCSNSRYMENKKELIELYENIISTEREILEENYIVGGAYFEHYNNLSLEDKLYLIGRSLGVVEEIKRSGWFMTFLKQYMWIILLVIVVGSIMIKIFWKSK